MERRKVAIVLNCVPIRGRSIDEVRTALLELGAPCLPTELDNRQAFVTAGLTLD